MSTWSATQYLRFADERTRPCRDLAARIAVSDARRVIDLGCGPGNSTDVLAERWPDAEITGLDSSLEMLAAARASWPARHWIQQGIAEWAAAGGPAFDVVYSNAALQWVPDHAAIFPRLLARVAPAGALAVQMPAESESPAQRLMREMAASPAWRRRLTAPVADWHSQTPDIYYDVLSPHAVRLDIWRTDYVHLLDGPEGIVEWYRGSGLRPFLSKLPSEADRDEFLREYADGVSRAYPRRADGRVLFPFLRLFLIAYLA